VQVWFKYGGL